MTDTGFESYSTDALLRIYENLLSGIDKVAAAIEDGNFTSVQAGGKASPSESGQVTLWFLTAVTQELENRKVPLT